MGTERLVIVGGSAAGARAAESAVGSGFTGQIDVISRDLNAPYYRPALSKQLLKGTWQREQAAQPIPVGDNIAWHFGDSAVGLEVDTRTISLDNDSTLAFDRLVLAGGCRPRQLPGMPGRDVLPTVHTIQDVATITARLGEASHVIIIGGGLIGSEAASTLAARGIQVTIVDPSPAPLARALGPLGNDACLLQHSANGVNLRLGTAVEHVTNEDQSFVIELQGGEVLRGDAAVLCIGVVPDTEWLAGSGITILADGSIDCDANLIARGSDFVAAAGDVATWESTRAGRKVRVEHWLTAVEQGAAAARNVLLPNDERIPFDNVPMFWTEQHGKLIHFLGHQSAGSTWDYLEGAPGEDGMVATATTDGRISGYLLINAPQRLSHYRQQMLQTTKLTATRN